MHKQNNKTSEENVIYYVPGLGVDGPGSANKTAVIVHIQTHIKVA